MMVQVQSYAGYKGDQRPVEFRIEGHRYLVQDILDQWYGPEHAWYKVRADDGNVYILRHCTSVPDGMWELISFRNAAG